MHRIAIGALLGLQCFHVLFLGLHDWIPLGALNNVKAVKTANPDSKLIAGTLMSVIPFAFGFFASASYVRRSYPGWLLWWLWVSYALLFFGEVKAWWIPYLVRFEPTRAARYRAMFRNTHAFLPIRNGIQPNTLHVVLHIATLMTLAVLSVLTI